MSTSATTVTASRRASSVTATTTVETEAMNATVPKVSEISVGNFAT
jgi:hypothetical protein